MPIYEYRCADCGQKKDYLQKISDAPIDACPACGSTAFAKALTAAGFQLKGSGWYATDFKSGGSNTSKPASTTTSATGTTDVAAPTESKIDSTKTDTAVKSESTGGSSCKTGCACH